MESSKMFLKVHKTFKRKLLTFIWGTIMASFKFIDNSNALLKAGHIQAQTSVIMPHTLSTRER